MSKIINPDENSSVEYRKPKHKYQITDSKINSLISTEKFLIVGTVGEINGYLWKDLFGFGKSVKSSWNLQLPIIKKEKVNDKSDVNCLFYEEKTSNLYAGCGDNFIHIFSLDDGRILRSIEAHEDFIHCLHSQ